MYKAKSIYFDENAEAQWASAVYGPEEVIKLDRLFKSIGPMRGLKILEPGCGTGRLTEILADRVGREGAIVALDISPRMIDKALRRTAQRSNIKIYQCSMEEFPLLKEDYDLVLCHQVFPHFADKGKVLAIFSNALKPEGKLIIIHFINSKEINDLHRKAGTAVEMDMMPEENEMKHLIKEAGMDIRFFLDDEMGYILSASKKIIK